ncbi:hypothetical protein DRQ33_05395 [bacterium]|nr:MAG: hypothetical protein DRQ33_05395 [bacterium]
MNFLLERLIELGGIPLIMLIIGYLTGRYLKPWIHSSDERLCRAQEIALIADRITDEMILLFPEQRWDNWLNDAVDKLIKSCKLKDADVAHREIATQIRKKLGNE